MITKQFFVFGRVQGVGFRFLPYNKRENLA